MRYFKVDGTYVPKHCKFGPRPNEGAVITHEDWWRINDHLTRSQRDQDNAIAKVAKEEAKKQASFEMTRSWENTLTVRNRNSTYFFHLEESTNSPVCVAKGLRCIQTIDTCGDFTRTGQERFL